MNEEDFDYEEDDIISEAAEYSPKSEFSKPKIVMEAFQKCVEARGKEMKAGYYNEKIDNHGNVQRVWIPDARDVFFGTVEALYSLLTPECLRDKTFQKNNKFIREKISESYLNYCYEERKFDKNEQGEIVLRKTGFKYMPELNSTVIIKDLKTGKGTPVKDGWNDKVNHYKNQLVIHYDNLFSELNKVIDALNYFKSKPSF